MNTNNAARLPIRLALTSALAGAALFPMARVTRAADRDPASVAPRDAAAALTIPTPPTIPANLPFSEEVTGRHLLYDTKTMYHNAAGVAFSARWSLAVGGVGEVVMASRIGAETLRANVADRKLAILVETMTLNGEHEIRRAGSDGTELSTTHFLQENPKSDARRTRAVLTLDETTDLQRALQQVQLNPFARAAEFAIDARPYVAGADAVIWQRGTETLPGGAHGEVVYQVESENANGRAEERRARQRVCRYIIDDDNHHLLRFEEWEIDRDRARPSRRRQYRQADGRTATTTTPAYPSTVNYRREDYSGVTVSDAATAVGSNWTLTGVPANYVEKPLPDVNLPAAPKMLAPDAYDPRALKLLEKWRAAQERYVSLTTEIDVAERSLPRTADSRPMRRNQLDETIRYQVAFRHPAKARVVVATVERVAQGGPGGRGGPGGPGGGGRGRRGMGFGAGGGNNTPPLNATFISDGEQVTAVFGTVSSSQPLENPSRLAEALTQIGLHERYDVTGIVFSPPPSPETYDKVTYDGTMLLEGSQPVESVTFHRYTDQRDGRYMTELTTQYFFASDGLPRVVESKTVTNGVGLLERDQPPVQTLDVRFINLGLDTNPSEKLFVKP